MYEPTQIYKRDTRSYLGMKYPSKTYSTTGNYFLIKYEETFNYISGIDVKNNHIVNMRCKSNIYESLGENFHTLLIGDLDNQIISLKVNEQLIIISKQIDKLI